MQSRFSIETQNSIHYYYMNKLTLTLAALAVCTLTASALTPTNLLSNGSFENTGTTATGGQGIYIYTAGTALPGWTISGPDDVHVLKTPDIGNSIGSNFNFAQDASFYLDLSGNGGAHPTVYQDFATSVAGSYKLTFYIGAPSTPGNIINVKLTGSTSLSDVTYTAAAAGANINWTLETVNFTANSTTTRVSFNDTTSSDDNAAAIDNVSVVSTVPEPATNALMVIGFAVVAGQCVRRKRA